MMSSHFLQTIVGVSLRLNKICLTRSFQSRIVLIIYRVKHRILIFGINKYQSLYNYKFIKLDTN